MAIVRLQAIGSIEVPGTKVETDSADSIERMALLVYAGDFDSADGPVKVTPEQLAGLVANHNSALSKVARLAGGAVRLKDCPPVQLDHSTSARDTIGRLMGDIILGDHIAEDTGVKVSAVYGRLRILGRENVERVNDGRWTHLSLGADFERGKLVELTMTPFPAAASASLLTSKKDRKEVYCDYPDGKIKCTVEIDEATGKYHALVDGKEVGDGFVSKETAVEETKKVVQAKLAPIPKEATTNMESGEMNVTKLKGYLVGHKKMTEKDADDQIVHLSKLEGAEDMKKLVAEVAEWNKTRLAAVKTGFADSVSKARLEASQGRILTRLSKLRAEGKITPAEVKKMDLVKLASSSDKDIELVLKTYDDREPVIIPGQFGTIKGTELSQLGAGAGKEKVSKLEAETRANMPLLKRADEAKTKLNSEHADNRTEDTTPPPVTVDADKDGMAYFETEYGEISKMMADGKHGEAKERLKAYMTKHLAMRGGHADHLSTSAEETERHLSALAENMTKMQAQFDELAKIADEQVA